MQQALDQPQLVVRVDDLEILRQPRLAPVAAQHAMRKAVKRANPEVLHRQFEQGLDATAHLGGRLVGKRHGQQALWRDALDIDEPGGAVDEHARLAAAGASNDERGFCGCGDGLTLRVVQDSRMGVTSIGRGKAAW